jgi:hypothetical protein
MIKPMLRFNELGNFVGHGDARQTVDRQIGALLKSVPRCEDGSAHTDLHYAAGYLCGFLDISCSTAGTIE